MRYRLIIDLDGDPGSIETAIDEIVSAIPCMELDSTDVGIYHEREIE